MSLLELIRALPVGGEVWVDTYRETLEGAIARLGKRRFMKVLRDGIWCVRRLHLPRPVQAPKYGRMAKALRALGVDESVIIQGSKNQVTTAAHYAMGPGNYRLRTLNDGSRVRVWRLR